MAALTIVEHLNVFEDGGFGLCPRSKAALVDHLLLQRCEEAFHRRIVQAFQEYQAIVEEQKAEIEAKNVA